MIKQLQMKMLLIIALLGWGVSAGADTMGLTFDLSSNPGGWPDTDENVPTVLANYTYTLDDVDYTFALKNVKWCYFGYTMISSGGVLGLPALEGYKLTKVVAKNSGDCSTATKVGISSSASSNDYIDGGDPQTWSTTSSSYTYDLTRTVANTMYYLYVTNENAQVVELQLTYDYINVELVDGQPFTNNVQKDGVNISYTR
nr:hypothetical protein [Prevotella sp.]